MPVKHCAVCNVRMSKGHKKGPKPVTCSKSACKKKWASRHITLDQPYRFSSASWYNRFLYENPDAWDGYFDIE